MRPKRKRIPLGVQRAVEARQEGRCAHCGGPLGPDTEYDHRPPLWEREVSAEGTDYVPPQLDSDHIHALHVLCHLERTTGRKADAERTVTTKGSDAHRRKLERRRTAKPKRKAKIPQRVNPWPKGRKIRSRKWKKPT